MRIFKLIEELLSFSPVYAPMFRGTSRMYTGCLNLIYFMVFMTCSHYAVNAISFWGASRNHESILSRMIPVS
jgi:putative component of membrane protein insertase Oxa1/YidC/SpoIIIJ protein YidD